MDPGMAGGWVRWPLLAAFATAHVRRHTGEHWPFSGFDLYSTRLEHDQFTYQALQFSSSTEPGVPATPFDSSVCSSSGVTRSYGYLWQQMQVTTLV